MNPASPVLSTDRLFDLVADALERPSTERAAFLTGACGTDAVLLAEALSLVQHDADAGEFLGQPAYALAPGEDLGGLDAGSLRPGEMLGECRVISLLGEGGMGEVYLADDTKLERRVAVKLLKQRLDDASLGRRFRHERKVLAGLTHPNIARLYGGGTTPEGRGYLVMEYVEGERLDRYCETRGLDVGARLALFRKVCAAVAYAHQNLVVHRDLKPANIRVTREGEPKLLDFGIAKLLDPEGAAATGGDPTLTLHGAMTPEYASPEQIRGEPITTSTDVYSLGVVLFELLTGQRPFAHLKGRRADELARAICEEEPPRASTVVKRQKAEGKRQKEERWKGQSGVETDGLRADSPFPSAFRLPPSAFFFGDLDNIVTKALRKEPVRRYPSVLALSEDVRRYCEGLPVTARKDTLGYRAGKFVRRNKVGVAAAALVFLALVGGLVATAWQARVAASERDRARTALHEAQTAHAQSELARRQAERLNGFLQTLLGSANPEHGPGRDLKVIEVLDRAGEKLDQELAGQPALLAQAHLTIGQAYTGLSEVEPAMRHLQSALALNRQLYGEDSIATARSEEAFGMALLIQHKTSDAEPPLRAALKIQRAQPVIDQSAVARILTALERLLALQDRFEEATPLASEVLAATRKSYGEISEPYAEALYVTGMLHVDRKDPARAEDFLQRSVAIRRQLGIKTPAYANVLCYLAYDLLLQGKIEGPEKLLRESMDLFRAAIGEENIPYRFDQAVLGFLYFERSDYPAAEREMRTALDYLGPRLPKESENMAGVREVLGISLTRQGRPAEGEPLLRAGLEQIRAEQMHGLLTAPAVAESALAECLLAQKKFAEAEPLLLESYGDLKQRLGDHAPKTVEASARLHDLHSAWNRPDEAARHAGAAAVHP